MEILLKKIKRNVAPSSSPEQSADNVSSTDTQKLYEQMIENYLDTIRKVESLKIEYQMLHARLNDLK